MIRAFFFTGKVNEIRYTTERQRLINSVSKKINWNAYTNWHNFCVYFETEIKK